MIIFCMVEENTETELKIPNKLSEAKAIKVEREEGNRNRQRKSVHHHAVLLFMSEEERGRIVTSGQP